VAEAKLTQGEEQKKKRKNAYPDIFLILKLIENKKGQRSKNGKRGLLMGGEKGVQS